MFLIDLFTIYYRNWLGIEFFVVVYHLPSFEDEESPCAIVNFGVVYCKQCCLLSIFCFNKVGTADKPNRWDDEFNQSRCLRIILFETQKRFQRYKQIYQTPILFWLFIGVTEHWFCALLAKPRFMFYASIKVLSDCSSLQQSTT